MDVKDEIRRKSGIEKERMAPTPHTVFSVFGSLLASIHFTTLEDYKA